MLVCETCVDLTLCDPVTRLENVPGRVLYIGNLPLDVIEEDIYNLANAFGSVARILLLKKQAFVELANLEDAREMQLYYSQKYADAFWLFDSIKNVFFALLEFVSLIYWLENVFGAACSAGMPCRVFFALSSATSCY